MKDNQSGSENLIDGISHSVSVGANGVYSSKLSGDASIGYSVRNFDNVNTDSQSNLISSIGLSWRFNSKTNFGFDLSRSFSPSASGFSMFSTMARLMWNTVSLKICPVVHTLVMEIQVHICNNAGNRTT